MPHPPFAERRSALLFTLLVCGYFLLQFALRLSSGPALEFDEAEALWYARDLRFGYNAQPPLYFWLQNLVLHLPLPPLAALAALKQALFAAALLSVFALCRRIDPLAAPAATLSLGLLPEILWDMQRDRTHTVLLLLLSALATLAMLAARQNRSTKSALRLGAVLGLGLLSKPNFAFLAAGLLAAARRSPAPLPRRQITLALFAALALVAPWAIWAATHPDLAGGSLHKLRLSGESALMRRLHGIGNFASALLALLGLASLVLGTLWAVLCPDRRDGRPLCDTQRLILSGCLVALCLAFVTVLAAGAAQTQSRWLLPLVFLLPPLATLHLHGRLTAKAARRLTLGLAVPWLLVLPALPLANHSAARQADFPTFDRQLAPDLPLVSSQTILLGNLVNIASPRPLFLLSAKAPQPATGTAVLLVEPKGGLATAARLGYVLAPDSVRTVTLTHGDRTRHYQMATALAP